MRVLTHFTGTVRDFRRWLAKQNRQAQIIDLAEYREKKKAPLHRCPREKVLKVTSIIAQEA